MSRKVETLTGGESVPRCCSCLYMRRSRFASSSSAERVAGRIEEVSPVLHAHDRFQQVLVVGLAVDRVDRCRVDDQKRRFVELVEEPRIRFTEPLEVFLSDELLVRYPARSDAAHQYRRGRLQVHDEIGLRRVEL